MKTKHITFNRRQSFGILSALFLLGYSAIIRADFLYMDDMGRAYSGTMDWTFGRVLNNVLSYLMSFSTELNDVSPLTQILAALLLALSAVVLIFEVYPKERCTIADLAAGSILALNPYFLECISYKFDAPYMAFSIFASILPTAFRKKKWYPAVAFLGVLGMCCTYQASSGIFPMVVIAYTIGCIARNEGTKKERGSFFLISALCWLAALGFYKLVIMNLFYREPSYVSASLPSLPELLPTYLDHMGQYLSLVRSDFRVQWLLFAALIVLFYLLFQIGSTVKTGTSLSAGQKAGRILLILAGTGLMTVLMFGIYPFLSKPIFACRAMYGFCVLLCLLALGTTESLPDRKILVRAGRALAVLSVCCLSWCFFSFAFTYGNALDQQKSYIETRMQMVTDDLVANNIIPEDQEVNLTMEGSLGYSPVVERISEHFPILEGRLVPGMFTDSTWGFGNYMDYYPLPNVRYEGADSFPSGDLPLVRDTSLYKVCSDGTSIRVIWKEATSEN